MTSANVLPRPKDNVVVVKQDDSDYFLVNLERGDSVAVDKAEVRVFESCRKGTSLEDIARVLAEELSADREYMLERVRTAIEHFREWGLVST